MSALELPGWRHSYSGKVRDLYVPVDPDDERLLVVASDRISAFDFALDPAIPGKGALLTRLSRWWFAQLDFPNHLADESDMPADVADRAMIALQLDMLPIECVVRGYLTGSGWAEYQTDGTVCGVALPAGLSNGDKLPEPIFTPAYKAPNGEHDENITFEQTVALVGAERAEQLRAASLALYAKASALAEARGLVLADTKFEFGIDAAGTLRVADEVLTSDSSRYWDASAWQTGETPGVRMASFDKQFVRDWLSANWNKQGTPPTLPADVVAQTAAKYAELITRLGA